MAQAGDVYKYVDERGNTLYTDKPIPGAVRREHRLAASAGSRRSATTPRSRPRPTASSPPAISASPTRRTTQRVAANVAKDLEASRAERCKKAREDYQQVHQLAPHVSHDGKDGKREYLNDAELAQAARRCGQGSREPSAAPKADPLLELLMDAALWTAFSFVALERPHLIISRL